MITYSGNPAHSPRDQVRFLLADVSTSTAHLQDEEIDFLLSQYPSPIVAASHGASIVAARYASYPEAKTVDGLTISYGDMTKRWNSLAASLSNEAGRTAAMSIYAGGISRSDKEQQEADSDWEKPFASLGMHDYPGTDPLKLVST